MRYIILILLAVFIVTSLPTTSHAIGLFKYLWDAVANQLGLDRGPIPKTFPKFPQQRFDAYGNPVPDHVYVPGFHLQAEGF
jgi:hypothetical protein